MAKTIIVFGASGEQGAEVVHQLMKDNLEVRAALRSSSKRVFPMSVEIVSADFSIQESLQKAAEGCSAAVLILPLVFDPKTMRSYGESCIEALEATEIEHLVYNASICIPDKKIGYAFFDKGIRPVIEKALSAKFHATILRPPLYLDNLLAPWTFQGVKEDSVLRYPMPAEQKIPWSCYWHQAAIVTEAVRRGATISNKVHDISMPNFASGNEIASAVSQAVGRPITYQQINPKEFADKVANFWNAEAAEHVRTLYEILTQEDHNLLDRDYSAFNSQFETKFPNLANWVKEAFAQRENL